MIIPVGPDGGNQSLDQIDKAGTHLGVIQRLKSLELLENK